MNWEKVCPNLSYTSENKIGKLPKAWLHFKLNMMIEIFRFLKFQEFINELGKYVFHWEKWNFEPIGSFAHTTEFLTIGKALLILLLLYLQILRIQI